MVACVGMNRSLILDVQKGDGNAKSGTLGRVSVETADQRLMLRASGCLEGLTAVEVSPVQKSSEILASIQYGTFKSCMLLFSQARIHYLSSRIWSKLLERIKTLQNLLIEFRRQVTTTQQN